MNIAAACILALMTSASACLPAADGTGLSAIYFSGADFSGTSITRTDPTIDFDWSTAGPGLPGIGPDYFSVMWHGQLQAPATGTYTIYATSDDGIMVAIDGTVLLVNWTPHSATENSATIALIAGKRYAIEVRYYQDRGDAVARLSWSGPSLPKAIIPQTAFSPAALPLLTPLAITSKTASRTSPAWLEGSMPEGASRLDVAAGTAAGQVTRERRNAWFACTNGPGAPLGIALDPAAPLAITVTSLVGSTSSTIAASLSWTVTDLSNLPYGLDQLTVRAGDALLLAASGPGGAGSTVEIDTDYDGTTFRALLTGPVSGRFPATFSRVGLHDVRARIDGVEVGKLPVAVVSVDLDGPIADEVAFQRVKKVTIAPASLPADAVAFTSNDPEYLIVTAGAPAAAGVQLDLLPLSLGNRMLQARLGALDGPLLAQQRIDAFTLRTDAATFMNVIQVLPDGSQLAEAHLYMHPLVHDLTVTLTTFVSGVTFDDSTTERIVSTNQFTPSGSDGIYTYRLLRSPSGHDHWCHTFVVTQDGVTISR